MRNVVITAMLCVVFGLVHSAQEQLIDLKDGGRLIVRKDGTMVHLDCAGNRVKMRDAVTMEARDGTTVMMKNDLIWKTIIERGTLRPVQ